MNTQTLISKHSTKSWILAHALLVLPQQSPDIEIKNFALIETQDNWQNLELNAELAKIYKKQDLVGIKSPDFKFWNKSGNSTKILGSSGIIESKSGDIQIEGPSKISSEGGLRFNTNVLHYFSKDQMIRTKDELNGFMESSTGSQPTLRFSGTGMDVDLKTQSYTIKSKTSATQRQGTNVFNIRSESSTIFPIQNKAHFFQNATIQSQTLNLSGDSAILILKAGVNGSSAGIDGIEMTARPGKLVNANLADFKITSKGFKAQFLNSGELKQSEAIGTAKAVGKNGIEMSAEILTMIPEKDDSYLVNLEKGVQILLDERIAECEFAVYNTKTGAITLNKFATVTKGKQKLNGEVIKLSTNNSEITVENASGTLDQESTKKKLK